MDPVDICSLIYNIQHSHKTVAESQGAKMKLQSCWGYSISLDDVSSSSENKASLWERAEGFWCAELLGNNMLEIIQS